MRKRHIKGANFNCVTQMPRKGTVKYFMFFFFFPRECTVKHLLFGFVYCCNSLYIGLSQSDLSQLQIVQNATVFLARPGKREHGSLLLTSLHSTC